MKGQKMQRINARESHEMKHWMKREEKETLTH